MIELGAMFFGLTLLLAIVGRLSPDRTAKEFCKGAGELTTTALLIAFAYSISIVLEHGQVIDTVIGNIGTFNSWGLHFTLVRYVTPVIEEIPSPVTKLAANVPNPFNPQTEISFELERPGQTRLSIFDVRGMLVRQLVDDDLPAGPHTRVWDGLDRTGRAVGSGTYLYRLESGPVVLARKMLLIR